MLVVVWPLTNCTKNQVKSAEIVPKYDMISQCDIYGYSWIPSPKGLMNDTEPNWLLSQETRSWQWNVWVELMIGYELSTFTETHPHKYM